MGWAPEPPEVVEWSVIGDALAALERRAADARSEADAKARGCWGNGIDADHVAEVAELRRFADGIEEAVAAVRAAAV